MASQISKLKSRMKQRPGLFGMLWSQVSGSSISRTEHPKIPQTKRLSSTDTKFPTSAEIVVAGAGAVGSSVAYHLTKYGKKDVLVLEQGSLGCGTSWHAVGLLGRQRTNSLNYNISKYGFELYLDLESETGLSTGVKKCGNVIVARTKDRAISMKRLYDKSRQFGLECELMSPKEAQQFYPIMKIDDLQLALWSPNEGAGNASDICSSLMKGATLRGATFIEGVGVRSVATDGKKVIGVDTDRGFIHCDQFVNCGGQWARELGMRTDIPVNIPLHSCEHFYIVTKPINGVHNMLPVLRDYDSRIYIREWSGGLMAGGFEPVAKPCFYETGVPENFEFQLLEEDWDHFDVLMQGILNRIPAIANAEIRQFVNGPESFTPDGKYLFGEAAEVKDYYVAAGMNSSGIVSAAGMGRLTAELITEGSCSWDTSSIDIKRFSKEHNNKLFLRERARQTLSFHYAMDYPDMQATASRPLKTSPLYDVLMQYGAQWGDVGGWERPKWFTTDGKIVKPTFGKPDWLGYVEAEYKACVEEVGVMDLSWQSKVEISSDDESCLIDELQYLFAEDIDVGIGTTINSSLLKKDGTYLGIVTLYRMTEKKFLLITTPQQHNEILPWIQRNARTENSLNLVDVTSKYCAFGVFGPSSKELLQGLTLTSLEDFSTESFKIVDLGYASDVILQRGFLGSINNWQAYVPTEMCRGLYQNIMDAGPVKNVGQYAVNSLRVHAGIPDIGAEIGPLTSPAELGKFSYANSSKNFPFIGKQALEDKMRRATHSLMTVSFGSVNDDSWPWGGEPVRADGNNVGSLASVSFDFTNGRFAALGVLDTQRVANAEKLSVRIAGQDHTLSVVNN